MVIPAHALGPLLDLLAHVPVRAFVREATGVAVPEGEGREAGHDTGCVPVALRAGHGLRGLPHLADGLEDAVAGLAVVLVYGHGSDLEGLLLPPQALDEGGRIDVALQHISHIASLVALHLLRQRRRYVQPLNFFIRRPLEQTQHLETVRRKHSRARCSSAARGTQGAPGQRREEVALWPHRNLTTEAAVKLRPEAGMLQELHLVAAQYQIDIWVALEMAGRLPGPNVSNKPFFPLRPQTV